MAEGILGVEDEARREPAPSTLGRRLRFARTPDARAASSGARVFCRAGRLWRPALSIRLQSRHSPPAALSPREAESGSTRAGLRENSHDHCRWRQPASSDLPRDDRGWSSRQDDGRRVQGTQGRSFRGSGRLHADLPQESPAGLSSPMRMRSRPKASMRSRSPASTTSSSWTPGRRPPAGRARSSSWPTATAISPRRSGFRWTARASASALVRSAIRCWSRTVS